MLGLVNIGVVLLGQFKVCGLNFSLSSVSPDAQLIIKIVLCVAKLRCSELSLHLVDASWFVTTHYKYLFASLENQALDVVIVVLVGNE